MAICSIPECDRPIKGRELCRAHYLRWWRYGDALAGRGAVKPGIDLGCCAVEGCDRPQVARRYCTGHYQRVLKHGVPGVAELEAKRPGALCDMEGCDRKHYARGMCTLHYTRWFNHGNPETVQQNGAWVGDAAGYSAVHERLVRSRGSARLHACAHCGTVAYDWAYDGMCPDELLGQRHGRWLLYSTDPDHYMPLCRKCHSAHDRAARKSRDLVATSLS